MVATYVTAWLRAVTLELAPSELRLSDCALTGQRRWSVVMPGPRGCMVICEGCALRYCCRCHLSAVDNLSVWWGEGIYGLKHLCAYCALRWREGWTLPIIQAHVRDAILQSLDQQQQQQ